jgi:tetratricopeptide (TPR) repeat protein
MMSPSSDKMLTALLLVIAVICIHGVRANVAAAHARAKEDSDVHLLPPPKDVVVMSLGYRAALADVLWAQVLVAQGLRTMDRRRYDTIADMLDTINELDPEFRDPYLWSDALINLQVTAAKKEDIERTRMIVERGTRNRPLDPEVWRTAGQFVAFTGPGTLIRDPEEVREWRHAGAKLLARAAELGGDVGFAGWSAVASASILTRQGERDAAIRLLRRTLAVTEDEELRENLLGQLRYLLGEQQEEAHRKRQAELLELSRKDLPFIGRTALHVLGPPFDSAYCAGGKPATEKRCALTWKDWAKAGEPESTP